MRPTTVRTPAQLGRALARLRRSRGLTQADLGVMAGMRQATVSAAENGKGGTEISTIFTLLAALAGELTLTERRQSQLGPPQPSSDNAPAER